MNQECCEECSDINSSNPLRPNFYCVMPSCKCHSLPASTDKELPELLMELKRVVGDLEVADAFIPDRETVTYDRLSMVVHKAYSIALQKGEQKGRVEESERIRKLVEKEKVDEGFNSSWHRDNAKGYNEALTDILSSLEESK